MIGLTRLAGATARGKMMDGVGDAADVDEATRYLRAIGEPTDAPERSPARGPPYWKSTVLRRRDERPDNDEAAQ